MAALQALRPHGVSSFKSGSAGALYGRPPPYVAAGPERPAEMLSGLQDNDREKRNASPGRRSANAAEMLNENGGSAREIPHGKEIAAPGKPTLALAATA
jgi:hypothetical protein